MLIKFLSFFKNDLFKNVLILSAVSSGFFLLVNKYPYFGILSILLPLFLSILFLFYLGVLNAIHWSVLRILIIIYVYFILSYFISGQNLSNFISFDFLRNDGNFFFCYVPFFAFAVPYFDYEKASRLYFHVIFITFSLLSIAGIISFLGKIDLHIIAFDISKTPLLMGFNSAHNATGSVYALASIFALVFLLKSPKRQKVYYAFVSVFCLAGLVLTQSRGSYFGFVAGALLVIWLNFRSIKKFLITIGILVAVSVPFIFVTKLYERFMMIFDTTTYATAARITLWKQAIFYFKLSPIFGIGFGRFNDADFFNYNLNHYGFTQIRTDEFLGIPRIFYVNESTYYNYSTAHAHNSYLQFLSETGIIGLGLIILFWILCYRIIMKAYNNSKSDFTKNVYLSCLGSILILFVMSFTENYFSATTMMMCMSVITSLSLGLYWKEKQNL